jgi:UDP-N-acetylmuramoyl-tripeptide--D-alanyl-D-alanine ligase
LVGEETRSIAECLAAATWTPDWRAALEVARETIRAGDLVLVKGSNSIGLGNLVAALTRPED